MIVGKAACGSDERRRLSVASERWTVLRQVARRLPRPLRFLMVGGIGLAGDIVLFTIIVIEGVHPLLAGLLALLAATVVTWRLNRAFTFDRSGRGQREEAMRYAAVTTIAQSTSYAVFAVLASTALVALPQAAIVLGAAAGALVSYNGHRLFAFAPLKPCDGGLRS
jgi:putative flippase GtrA